MNHKILALVLTVALFGGLLAVASPATAQEDLPLDVDVEPGVEEEANNFTYNVDASDSTNDTDIEDIYVDFNDTSGVDTSDIVDDDVNVTAEGVEDPGVDGVQEIGDSELLITPQDFFILDEVTGNVTITINETVVPNNGTFATEVEFHDDANEVMANASGEYTIEPAEEPEFSLDFNDQEIDGATVTVENVIAEEEGTVVVTYPVEDNLTIAAVTSGEWADEDLEIELDDTDGVPGEHTAHILPAEDVSDETDGAENVSDETADNVVDADTAMISEADEPGLSLEFNDQGIEEEQVTVNNVTSDEDATVVITYEVDGNLSVAGVTNGTFDDETVVIDLVSTDGFPGDHTAHILSTEDVSDETETTGNVSDDTANAVVDDDTAYVSVDATGTGAPARDTTNDGNLNDLRDDGFSIVDVQDLFANLDNPVVQQYSELFNFAGANADRVSIFDVQALFTEYQQWEPAD